MRNFTEVNYIPILHKHMLEFGKEPFLKRKMRVNTRQLETRFLITYQLTLTNMIFNFSNV